MIKDFVKFTNVEIVGKKITPTDSLYVDPNSILHFSDGDIGLVTGVRYHIYENEKEIIKILGLSFNKERK